MIRVSGLRIACVSTGLLLGACDCGGTPPGSGDGGGGGEAATLNRAPTATVPESVALFPGERAALLSELPSDPDGDTLTCSWTASPALAGVVLPTGCAGAEVAVDRALYEGGPAARIIDVQLAVSDGAETVTRTTALTVRDERGGDVDNTSAWEGRGYAESGARHGHCGAPGRPCQDLDDAMVNLRGRIADGDAVEPRLRVATTGTAYARDEVLLLDDDAANTGVVLGLECGFDPATWDKVSDTWLHTPIRFSSDTGVRIAASGVRLEGCDIQAVDALQPAATRTAVHVVDAACAIVDNRLHGAPPTLATAPEAAIGLHVQVTDPDAELEILVENNTIQGGTASETVRGLWITGGVPRVVGNGILGGRAVKVSGAVIRAREGGAVRAEVAYNGLIEGGAATQTAYGLHLAGGDLWLHDNEEILGCAIDCDTGGYVGVVVAAETNAFSTPLLERNRVRGVVGQHAPVQAVGLLLAGPAISRDGSYVGGRAGRVTGAMLRAPLRSVGDRIEGGTALDLDPQSPVDGRATGVELEASGVVLEGATVAGASATGPAAPVASGVVYTVESTLELIGSSVDSGPGLGEATGVLLQGGSSRLALQGSTVTAGDTAGDAGSRSTALHHVEGALTVVDGVLRSGLAETTQALRVQGDGTRALSGGQILAGDCSPAAGTSRGVWLEGSSYATFLLDVEVRGGDGCARSYGLHAAADTGRLVVRDSVVAGGQASQRAMGIAIEGTCRSCRIERSRIEAGGQVGPLTSQAVGLQLRGDGGVAALEYGTFVVASHILGGTATVSTGLELLGDAQDDIVALHNRIAAAGDPSSVLSVAVVLSGDVAVSSSHAGVFVGNLIDAGVGTTAIGYLEICSATGGLHKAEPYFSFNNAFWPAIDGDGVEPTAYVHRTANMDCGAAVDLTTIAQVNQLAYYGSGSALRASVDADPLLDADGVHLQAGSPLVDAAPMSDNYWPFAATSTPEDLLDADGEVRPCGAQADIGPDEWCP